MVEEVLKVSTCVWLQVHKEARSTHIPQDSYNMLWAVQTGCWVLNLGLLEEQQTILTS